MKKTELNIVSATGAAKPQGHYSQAILHENTIYLSTQLGISPKGESPKVGTIEQQTEQIIDNVEQILLAANSSLEKVIKVMIYISDIAFWPIVNEIYAKRFGTHKPARGVIPCQILHKGYQVAFDVIATFNSN